MLNLSSIARKMWKTTRNSLWHTNYSNTEIGSTHFWRISWQILLRQRKKSRTVFKTFLCFLMLWERFFLVSNFTKRQDRYSNQRTMLILCLKFLMLSSKCYRMIIKKLELCFYNMESMQDNVIVMIWQCDASSRHMPNRSHMNNS